MNNLKAILIHIPLVIIGIALCVVAIPMAILYSIIGLFVRRKLNTEYRAYLKEIEGRNFFCYNNRQNSYAYIMEEIIPHLPKGVEVIFLNGKSIESSNLNQKFISKAFREFRNYRNFPHLMKIRNGQVHDLSMNQELYLCLNQKKEISQFFDKMKIFFLD